MKQYFPYLQYIQESNPALGEIRSFILYPGMEFRSEVKWWPDSGVRPTLHEGIDFCYYTSSSGIEHAVTPEFKVPVMADGVIFAICKDYLGYTLFLDHGYDRPRRFLSIYAHMVPYPHLKAGECVKAGQLIGSIADTAGRKNRMPAHLHLSLMWADREISPEKFTWDLICYADNAHLINPLEQIAAEKIISPKKNHWKEKYGFNDG